MRKKINVLPAFRCRALIFFYFLLTLLGARPIYAQWHSTQFTAMTTRIELELWTNSAAQAEQLFVEVEQLFEQIEQRMSRYREDSELSVVNRSAHLRAMPVSSELFSVLREAQYISGLTQGAFDMTYASLGYLYDYRKRLVPNEQQRQSLQPLMDYRQVQLDPGAKTVSFDQSGLLLDLGGIAKGYAVDRGIALLVAQGIRFARLSAGGDMRLLGSKRGQAWLVGVKDPRAPTEQAVVLPLENLSISTSGDYERYFLDDRGERIHHILSPKTGKPAQGIQSVTVLGPKAIRTDALSTAIFVLGVQEGLAVIENIEGYDAIIIDAHRKMHYSKGLMPQGQHPKSGSE